MLSKLSGELGRDAADRPRIALGRRGGALKQMNRPRRPSTPRPRRSKTRAPATRITTTHSRSTMRAHRAGPSSPRTPSSQQDIDGHRPRCDRRPIKPITSSSSPAHHSTSPDQHTHRDWRPHARRAAWRTARRSTPHGQDRHSKSSPADGEHARSRRTRPQPHEAPKTPTPTDESHAESTAPPPAKNPRATAWDERHATT